MSSITPENWKTEAAKVAKELPAQEKIKSILRFAVLAPSTHNSQPWLFKITDTSCFIYYNSKIKLPESDLKSRNLYISFGCLIENLVIASEYFGVFDKVTYFPSKEKNLITRVDFKNIKKAKVNTKLNNKMYGLVNRITHRGVWAEKSIKDSTVESIKSLNNFKDLNIFTITDKSKIAKLADLTATGLKMAYKRPAFRQEMSKWINNNFSKRVEGIPGYALRMNKIGSWIFTKVVSPINVGPILAILNKKSVGSSPLVCVITAKTDSKVNWLNTGRLAQRVMVELNSEDVKTSIYVASVEIGSLYKEVQKVIGTNDIPQFLFSGGYMNHRQPPTPRHPIESKIIH